MSRADETGALAAATYFLGLYQYTVTTQDSAAWAAMSHPECSFCNSVLEDVRTKHSAGRVVIAGPIKIDSTTVTPVSPLMFSITAEITTGPDREFAADGSQLKTTRVNSGVATVLVLRAGDSWLARGVELQKRK